MGRENICTLRERQGKHKVVNSSESVERLGIAGGVMVGDR